MSILPKDDKQRKNLPIFKMIVGYFPKALREVTRVCVANNVRYNPERKPADITWARDKSTDQLGSLFRHLFEQVVDRVVFENLPPEVAAAVGFDKVYVAAEAAWRALANLEQVIEEQEATPLHAMAISKDHLLYWCIRNARVAPVALCDCDWCEASRRETATSI